MISKPAVERLPSLAGFRGLLALVVLLGHMGYLTEIFNGKVQDALGAVVGLGVGLVSGFFTLSGFILTWSHRPGDRPHAFWRRRFWRIVPNYVLAWAIATVFFLLSPAPNILLPPVHNFFTSIMTLGLVQCWVPNLDVCTGVNPPAWSLSSEVFFYALFPLLLVLARQIPGKRLGVVWVVIAVGVLSMPLIGETIGGPPAYSWLPMSANSIWFVQAFPPVRLLEFMLGIVTARLVQTGRWPRFVNLSAGTALFVVAILLIPVLPPLYAQGAALAIPICLMIAGTASRDIHHRPSFLSRPTMVALGDASYALYILHFPILLIGRTIFSGTYSVGVGVLILLVLMTATQAFALIVHRYFETPLARRWSRPRAKEPHPVLTKEIISRWTCGPFVV